MLKRKLDTFLDDFYKHDNNIIANSILAAETIMLCKHNVSQA